MARYTSITDKDVVLKFKGVEITVPANGYYESNGEDLEFLFPQHVRKIKLEEVVEQLEKRLLPPNIKEISTPKASPLRPVIREIKSPEQEKIVLNTPQEIPLAPIKEVTIKSVEHEKIINGLIQTTTDPDLKEFLQMIEEILKEG